MESFRGYFLRDMRHELGINCDWFGKLKFMKFEMEFWWKFPPQKFYLKLYQFRGIFIVKRIQIIYNYKKFYVKIVDTPKTSSIKI